MACTHLSEKGALVRLQLNNSSFVFEFSFDCHLLVHFGTEAGHEWFQNHTQEHQRIQSHVHNLGTANDICLCEHPRLVLLDV